MKTLFKVMVPAAMPYMFTGFRLSLGIAWLVIVAGEMLTGAPGVGGFLWQEYNSGRSTTRSSTSTSSCASSRSVSWATCSIA
jgi:ABC-type nitrate/sulfonate/bicarbonate transport system permease component